MTTLVQSPTTLAEQIWPSDNTHIRNVVLAVGGSLALWVSAKIQVPFYPVPITMQTFVVLLIGMAFGWRLGTATVLLYFAEGAVGLPVFAGTPEKGIGLAYMMGPTGGYLFGWILATMTLGWLASKGWGKSMLTTGLAMLVSNALIYVPGLLWLGTLLGWDKPILAWGLTPFFLGDLAKLLLAIAVLPLLWRLTDRSASPE